MTNEVMKPPRASCEFLKIEWDPVVETFSLDWFFEIAPEANQHFSMGLGMAEVKELIKVLAAVLPGDDSIRVSRETIAMILETLDHAKQVPNMSQADISFLTRRHAAIIERIEREQETK